MSSDANARLTRCIVCLESVEDGIDKCPHCDEHPGRFDYAEASPPSIAPGPIYRQSWLRQHWRPTITLSLVTSLFVVGVALRHLAPDRYQPPNRIGGPTAAKAVCDSPCWAGESCLLGKCVWQPPNDVEHLTENPTVGGPFPLAEDFVDAVIIDDERVAVSHLKGLEILNAKTGRGRSLINDAPQAQRLARVGDTLYVSSPKRLYVVDLKNERVLKSLDMGGPIEAFHRGGSGWRMLVSVPSTRSVAVIATDYHAEISRFFFGDDPVGPVAIDDSGKRALTTTGRVPISGLEPPAIATRYGAMYAFDPSRLSSQQDRVRSAMTDNAVDILMVPDGTTSYLLLRKTSELVVQKRQPSSTVRQIKRVKTCKQPEGLQLVRRTRRAVVRCNLGRAIDIIDLDTHRHIKRISLGVRVSDLAVSPDGTQAIAALPQDTKGAVAVIDLSSFQVRLHELSSDPQRVRLTPDGRAALILSDRTKKAWVLR